MAKMTNVESNMKWLGNLIIIGCFLFWILLLHNVAFAKDLGIEAHRSNYLVMVENNDSDYKNLEFQLSVKTELLFGIVAAYTQRSFWDIYAPSAPFREHNHNPELFVESPWSTVGYEHESNGMDGDDSRSWERVYARSDYEFKGLQLSAKVWHPFFLHENRELVHYFGEWESTLGYSTDKVSLSMTNRVKSSAVDLYYNAGDFYLYGNVFNGFGGSGMVSYATPGYSTAIGIALSR